MNDVGGHLVVGATSEIGRAIVDQLARQFGRLVIAARDEQELAAIAEDARIRHGAEVHAVQWQVDAAHNYQGLYEEGVAAFGRLEGVVLCQGFMASQDQAASQWQLAHQMIEVNYSATVAIMNRFADYFEGVGGGYLCGVSSVAGDRGRQSNYVYGSTKAAMSAYLAGLRNRLFRRGVAVITVKPGFVDTSMTWGLVNPNSPLCASPERVGRDVVKAIRRRRSVVYTPWFWRYIMLAIRAVPEPVFKRLSL